MNKSIFVPMLVFAAFLLSFSATFGSAADELREKAGMARQQAAELKKQGRNEEAEKVARKAAELAQAAEKAVGDRPKVSPAEIEKLQGRLKELVEKQRQLKDAHAPERQIKEFAEQIAKTERELHGLRAGAREKGGPSPDEQHKREMAGKLEEAGRRITHLRIAADHLRDAGMQDLAGQLMQQAEKMEREVHEAKMHMVAEAEHRGHVEPGNLPAQLDELRREVGRLREEMKALGQHVKELERGRK
jgi:myosin heavy subunit